MAGQTEAGVDPAGYIYIYIYIYPIYISYIYIYPIYIDASEQPVVVAVLAAMYGAKPMTELMSEQSEEHCWQLQVSVFGSAAADVLAARLASEGELSKAVTQHLMDLSWLEMPECQHPLLQQVLVSELGDLEACWRDSDLKD
jgi:hypothetical protein